MAVSDYLFAVVQAGVQLSPAAAAAAAGINSLLQTRKDRDQDTTQQVFCERLAELQGRVDDGEIHKHAAEISEIAHNCRVASLRTAHDEKRRAAASILCNALLKEGDPDKRPLNELDHYARSLESLSLDAFHVLREALAINRRNPMEVTSDRIAHTLGISSDLCVALLRQLYSCDFMLIDFANIRAYGHDPHTLRVRPLAEQFVTHVLDAGSSEGEQLSR